MSNTLPTANGVSSTWKAPEHRDIPAVRDPDASQRGTDAATLPQVAVLECAAADLPRVPGYEILCELGRGAMGVVYKARQIALHRIVALKMLHAARRSDAEQRLRFRNEVEIIARLQHPNIVQIHDVGEHAGRPFFAMEFLGGGSLADSFSGRPQPPSAAAELIETLARAMHAVHAKGIVHRDLKPFNVVRTADGCPKITDFGLAHRQSSDLTVSGEVLGTPYYMAPEQAAGRVREVSPAADVYALGAILYELLTGRPPFRGVSVMDVVRQVQDSDPVAPRRMEPRTPRDLETICLKCLSKEPGRRYASAGDLADDLRRFRMGESICARPPAWPERIARWTRRRPTLAVLFAALILAAVATPLALLGHTLQLQEALDREQKEREHAREAEEQALRNEAEARVAHLAADLKLASTLFNAGDVFQLPSLLGPYQREAEGADDLRDFAWWYLRQHSPNARPALAAFDGPVHLLEYTSDGRSLITAGGPRYKQALKGWELAAGRPSFQQSLHWKFAHEEIDQAAFAPGAALVAAITQGETIVGWDLATGRPRFQFKQPREAIFLALSPDGRRLAVSGPHATAIWDCAGKRHERTLATPPASRLAFAPDGATLLAASVHPSFRGLQWWDAKTGATRGQANVPQGVRSAFYSPQGTFLLLLDGAGNGAIWDTRQRIPLHWSSQIGPAVSLAVSADERTLAVGDATGGVRLWDIAAAEIRARYRWQPNAIVRLAFAPDHRTLAAATAEGQIQQIDATMRHVPNRLPTAVMSGRALAWSADGETVAAAAWGGAAHLFDRRSGSTRAVLSCPVQNIRCLAFAPDGRTLAVVCLDEALVRLWDIAEQRWRPVTAPHPSPVAAIAFSPDGRWLASLEGNTVRLWDPVTAAPRGLLAAAPNTRTLAFPPDGTSLLTAGSTIQVWNLSGGEHSIDKPASVVSAGPSVVCLAVSRDGRWVAGGSEDGGVRLWKLAADRRLTADKAAVLRSPGGGAVRTLGFTPDVKTLLVGQGGGLELWDLPARRLRDTIDDPVDTAAFSPDGRTLAAVGRDGAVYLWKPADAWRVTRPLGQSLDPVRSLVYSADGRTLMTAGRGVHRSVRHRSALWATWDTAPLRCPTESLRFWDAETGREELLTLPARQVMAPPHLVAHSADGRFLAAGGEDGGAFVWDWSRKELRRRLFISDAAHLYTEGNELNRDFLWTESSPDYASHSETIAALAFSPDGQRLAMAGNRGSFRIWQVEDGRECCHWRGDANGSAWLAFTLNGDSVAGSRGGQVCIWDAHTGALRTRLGVETDSPVLGGVFAPTGDVLAAGSTNGSIRLWSLRDGKEKRLPGGHQDRVTALAFTPDGKTLASAGWDRTVRLWNLRAGREVATLEGHRGRIHTVAFSPDGKVLASGGEDGDFRGEVLLWRR